MKQGKKIKTCCHHGNKRNYVWNSSYTSKAEKNCCYYKNGNVDALQPQVQNCYEIPFVEALWASNKMFITP